MRQTVRLAQTVLASSIFVASIAYGDTKLEAQYDEVVAVTGPQLKTSQTGNIEITSTGKINANNTDGIQVDSASAVITIDANNTTAGNNAIIASGALGNGINILNGAGKNTATAITVNSGSNISTTGSGHAIVINDSAATVTNSGQLLGGASAIEVASGGVTSTIINSGVMRGGISTAAPTIIVDGNIANGGTALTLTNYSGGLISATGSNDAVQINQNFTLVTNALGATISTVNGNGINLGPTEVAPITGDVENYGTITATGTGAALKVTNAYNGVINNNSGGILQNTSNSAGGGVVVLNDSFNTFNNAGTIQETGNSGYLNAILISNNAPGTFNNSGLIQSTNQSATVFIAAGITGFNNTGSIIGAPSGAAINEGVLYGAGNNITFANGFVNNGIVRSNTAAPAINFQSAGANIIIPYFQQSGTVTGNVLLSSNGSTVNASQYALTMSGGTINGNVTSSSNNASLLQLNGGTITGTTTLGNVAGNIVNLAGTSLQTLNGGTGDDTFNLSGGSFTSLNGGVGNDTINVLGSFTQTGPVTAIENINVKNSGVYTVSNTIGGPTAFIIESGGLMTVNTNLAPAAPSPVTINAGGILSINSGFTFTTDTATNNGSLTIGSGGTLDLATYTQNAGASFSPVISATSNGLLQVSGLATFNPGSTINPSVNSGGIFIPSGTPYVVVTGNVVAADPTPPTLVQPQSAIVFFNKTTTPGLGGNITLTLGLNPLASVAQGDNAQAIGAALDPLLFGGTTNPELLAVLGQLELAPDSTTLTQELLQLAPSLNYALPASSRIAMDSSLDSVQIHLEQLHSLGPVVTEEEYREIRNYELYNGVSYGDRNVIEFGTTRFRTWAQVFGTIIDQHKRNQVEGYKADSAGVSVGGDWRLTNEALVGAALSFNKVETLDYTTAQNKIDTWSYQATVYGWFEPWDKLYFDTMLAVASHKYDTLRNMQIGNYTANATATFLGTQYGAQADVGYAFSQDNWYVAPYARFRYTYLDVGKYSETGAGGINLNVKNSPIDEMIAGIGLRLAVNQNYQTAIYVPEASATLLYDFAGKEQQMQSSFLGGGGFFYISSIKPAQLIQLYSLGVTAYTNDGYVAQLKFNFEHREQLFGYNAFLQISYLWD